MFPSNLLTNCMFSVVMSSLTDSMDQAESIKESIKDVYFNNFIGSLVPLKPCIEGYATYDLFISHYQNFMASHCKTGGVLKEFHDAIKTAILQSKEHECEDYDTRNEEQINRFKNCMSNIINEIIQENGEEGNCKPYNYSCLLEEDYDLLKDIFYQSDVLDKYENTTSTIPEISSRFITYFLRRYNYFIDCKLKDHDNLIKAQYSNSMKQPVPTKIELLNLPKKYNVLYFEKQLTVFKRLVTLPTYQSTTEEFINLLKKQIQKYVSETVRDTVDTTNVPIYDLYTTTLTTYYIVLDYLLSQINQSLSKTNGKAEEYLNGKSETYVAVIPFIYQSHNVSRGRSCLLAGGVTLIDNNDINRDELYKTLE